MWTGDEPVPRRRWSTDYLLGTGRRSPRPVEPGPSSANPERRRWPTEPLPHRRPRTQPSPTGRSVVGGLRQLVAPSVSEAPRRPPPAAVTTPPAAVTTPPAAVTSTPAAVATTPAAVTTTPAAITIGPADPVTDPMVEPNVELNEPDEAVPASTHPTAARLVPDLDPDTRDNPVTLTDRYGQEIPAEPATAAAGGPMDQLPLPPRGRQLAALLAAAGAVVVIAAAVITPSRFGGSDRPNGSRPAPAIGSTGTVIVEVTNSAGQRTQTTVTAPLTTVGTSVMAITTGPDGSVEQLPVIAVLPSGVADAGSSSARRGEGSGSSLPPATRPTSAPEPISSGTAPALPLVLPSTRDTDVRPGRDTSTATVIPGTSKLTGWVPASPSPEG